MPRQRDDPGIAQIARQRRQQRGLARPFGSDHQHVETAARCNAQQVGHSPVEPPARDQPLESGLARLAAPQRQDGTRRRRGRKQDHAFAAVAEADGGCRRGRPPHQAANDLLEMSAIAKSFRRRFDDARALDVDGGRPVREHRAD
jgi:hypothetical protein